MFAINIIQNMNYIIKKENKIYPSDYGNRRRIYTEYTREEKCSDKINISILKLKRKQMYNVAK